MKYYRTFLLALQTEMQYRANLIGWFVVGLAGPFTMVVVWFTVMGNNNNNVGGYDRGDLVIYYILMTMGWYIIGGQFSHMIGRDIKNGDINKTLLKPYSIVLAAAMSEQAWKILSLIITMPALLLILYFTRDIIRLEINIDQIGYITLSIGLAAILFALMQAIVGILAFWVTEIWPFINMIDVVLNLFGGMLAPIALLPLIVQKVTLFLPFRYMFYEPINMILGKVTDPINVLEKQVLFIVILFGIYRMMWNAGIKKYEGIGG